MPIITAAGIEIPTVESLLADVASEVHGTIDEALDVSVESPEGQLIGIVMSHLREAWETIGVAFNIDPRDSSGAMLESVCAITGTLRRGTTRSAFLGDRRVTVNLDAGTTLPAGSVASVATRPDIRFETSEEVSNPGGSPANVLVSMRCTEDGPVQCYADTLTVIATPVTGWNSVNNDTDVEPGRDVQGDADLRRQQAIDLFRPGSSNIDAIRAAILNIVYNGQRLVESCTVFENTRTIVDARGVPPKSIEVLVFDGVAAALPDNVIAQTIWGSKCGGINAHGNTAGIAVDVLGESRTVGFSRPDLIEFEIRASYTYDQIAYAGDDAARVAIADYMKGRARSEMLVRFSDVIDALYSVAGVTGVSSVRLFNSGWPIFTNYQMSARTFPLFDSGDVTVTASIG